MAKTFKTGDLKEVGRIKVSAKGLREIANKLEAKTGSDTVVNLMVYLTPGETPTDFPDLGYDFSTISTEAKKVEEAPKSAEAKVEEAKPVVEETKKTEEKPAETPKAEETPKPQETPKAEEVKPATPAAAETPKAEETPAPKAETPAPTVEETHAKEIKEKAQVITTEANKDLNMEQPK